jgi:hypothetical protein
MHRGSKTRCADGLFTVQVRQIHSEGLPVPTVELKGHAVIVNMHGTAYHLPNARCWK